MMKTKSVSLSLLEQQKIIQKRTEALLRVRERSSFELQERLLQAGFSSSAVKKEITRTLAAGLVEDERFTQLYVSGKKHSGWGQYRIEKELRRFGIDLKACEGYPESYFNKDDELDRAVSCLSRIKKDMNNKRSSCYRKLISKGFTSDIVCKAIAIYCSDWREVPSE